MHINDENIDINNEKCIQNVHNFQYSRGKIPGF